MEHHLTIRPHAVLFDWDNTLVDSGSAIHHALNLTFDAMGHAMQTHEEFANSPPRSLRESFPEIFGDRWADAMRIFYETYDHTHINDVSIMPGVTTLLEMLHAKGIAMGVVSNKKRHYLNVELEHLGLGQFFFHIVGSGDLKEDKPSPMGIFDALQKKDIDSSFNVWFVGDSSVDVACAQAAGCLPLIVGNSLQPHESYLHVTDFATLTEKIMHL
jgi:phosphoglycolate phosphatase